MAIAFANPNEKQVVTSWAKRHAIKIAKKVLIVSLIMSLGAFVEYKYHVIAGVSHTMLAKKGK